MTLLDWGIAALVLLFAATGYAAGVIVSGLALGGFAAGAFLGSRIGPALLSQGSASPYAPMMALAGGFLIGSLIATVAEGAGHVIRSRLVRHRPVATVDGVIGAALMGAFALCLAWVLGVVALNTPSLENVRTDVQRSSILSRLYEEVPPSGPVLNALNRIDPTPVLPPSSERVPAPSRGVGRDPEVQGAGASVVRVHGTACGLGVAGSGWVARPDVVVTNAHVVAGQQDTNVVPPDSSAPRSATVIHYEPRNDLAILRVDGLGLPPLDLAPQATEGSDGAVLGYPNDGPYSVAPARVGTTRQAISQDSYGRGPVERTLVSFRGRVISGNSGGPVVDTDGRVVTTVFAATHGRPPAGLGVPNRQVERALQRADGPVGTGPCAR